MLAVVAAAGARFDPGSVALALARRISAEGQPVLFIDADAAGTQMARRLGAASDTEYLPASRGLPSLMVCRQPLTMRLLADHCYSIETSGDPLWALFAPTHPAGASLAAAWLAEQADELAAIGAHRRVIVSGRLGGEEHLAPLLAAAPVALVVAPVESLEQAKALWTAGRAGGLLDFTRGRRALLVEGESPLADDAIAAESGMYVLGTLPVIEDERLLSLAGRRDRRIINILSEAAAKLLAAWNDPPRPPLPGRTGTSPSPTTGHRTRPHLPLARTVPPTHPHLPLAENGAPDASASPVG